MLAEAGRWAQRAVSGPAAWRQNRAPVLVVSIWTWAGFIGLHLSILLLLGAASVAVFEPVVPMAVVVAANEPPSELVRQALPLTGGFVLVAATVPTLLRGRTPAKFGANLLSSFILILFLGLNVSALGLVEMSTDSLGLVGEFPGLMALIVIGGGGLRIPLGSRKLAVRRRRARPPNVELSSGVPI